jgi:hypothetical protein
MTVICSASATSYPNRSSTLGRSKVSVAAVSIASLIRSPSVAVPHTAALTMSSPS